MYIKLALAIVAALQPLILMDDELPRPTPYQSDATIPNKISSGEKSSMSDREKAGFRGPVRQCIEQRTTPAFENVPAATYTTTTKYSSEGRILQSTTSNSVESGPPEFSTTYTYDSSGRLLKKTITSPGSPAAESKYNYDEKGRIILITGEPLGTSTFEYDDKGRKIRIVSPPSKPVIPEGTQYMLPVPEDEESYLPIPAGGHAKILFNERHQPVEWQVSDANGNLTNRLIRTYDESGRLAEVRYTMENILLTLPPEAQQEFMAQPGAAEELAKQLTEFLGEQRNFTRTTYRYDADGRLTEKHTYIGPSMESIAKITYNNHSDKSEEHTIMIDARNPSRHAQSSEVSSGAPPTPQKSEARYCYKYDTFRNWTERTISSLTSPNNVTVTRRTIVYY